MKRKPIFALLAVLLVTAAAASQPKKESERAAPATAKLQLTQCALKVSGMTCGGCAGMVEQGLLKVDGVTAAKVDWKSGDVQVEYDSKKTTPEKIVAAFNKAHVGFRAQLAEPKAK